MSNSETNFPSECLPEAVATFAAVSTMRCKRTSDVHRSGSDQRRPCSVHCQDTDAVSVSRESSPPPLSRHCSNGQPYWSEFVRKGRPSGPGETRLVPPIY